MSDLVAVQCLDRTGQYLVEVHHINFTNGFPQYGQTFELLDKTYIVQEVLKADMEVYPFPIPRIRVLEYVIN